MGVGRGYGKLLLFGEHAAVYGHPAVGLRLDDYLEVELETPAARSSEGVQWQWPEFSENELAIVRRAVEALPHPPGGGRLDVRGTLPTSVGFGSSAAFCTALIRAHLGADALPPEELWALAHELEHHFHGTPSGIDTGLSVYPGASAIHPKPPGLPRREQITLPAMTLLVGAIQRTSSTAELVAGIRRARETDATRVEQTLARLGELARAVSRPGTDAPSVGEAADEAQHHLAALGLSTPALDALLETLHAHGALGAKLSGAGGGGAFFGVFENTGRAEAAEAALRRRAEELSVPVIYQRTLTL
ncbi:MAG: mevalonate kinase [Spirochaetota bacterium]